MGLLRRIDFGNVTNEDLEHLASVCDQATFGLNQESVLDEGYHKSKKLDTNHFNPLFDTGSMNIALTRLLREELFCDRKEGTNIRIARYKLNVYGAGRLLRLL